MWNGLRQGFVRRIGREVVVRGEEKEEEKFGLGLSPPSLVANKGCKAMGKGVKKTAFLMTHFFGLSLA